MRPYLSTGLTWGTFHRLQAYPATLAVDHQTLDVESPTVMPVLILTADLELLDHLLAVAAAAGVEPEVMADVTGLRQVWSGSALVLIGVDQASRVAAMVLPQRGGVIAVGLDEHRSELHEWSVPLGASVVVLPSGSESLSAAVADASGQRSGRGRLLALVGGSGGVGVSTSCAALALEASRRGLRTLLVDADPWGGGLDLLLGLEREDGWRWPRLAGARGYLGDLSGQLPALEAVDVLSTSRHGEVGGRPQPEQIRSVTQSALRTHDLVVVDLPRVLDPTSSEVLRRADRVGLMLRADLRGLAAGRTVAEDLADACGELQLVVRTGRGLAVDAETTRSLGVPVWGAVPTDPGVVAATDRGDLPGRTSRGRLAKAVRMLLDTWLGDEAVAA